MCIKDLCNISIISSFIKIPILKSKAILLITNAPKTAKKTIKVH